jgi:hypothetical protein
MFTTSVGPNMVRGLGLPNGHNAGCVHAVIKSKSRPYLENCTVDASIFFSLFC